MKESIVPMKCVLKELLLKFGITLTAFLGFSLLQLSIKSIVLNDAVVLIIEVGDALEPKGLDREIDR